MDSEFQKYSQIKYAIKDGPHIFNLILMQGKKNEKIEKNAAINLTLVTNVVACLDYT